jgi:hypothetical protein
MLDGAVLGHKRVVLLFVWDAGRQSGDMPVQIGVSLLAAQGQQIGPLTRHACFQGESDSTHYMHHVDELVHVKISDNLLDVALRSYKNVTGQYGEARKKPDVPAIVVDDFFGPAGITIDHSAGEAWPGLGTPVVALQVERHTLNRARHDHL